MLIRLGLIGAILLCAAGAFAYVGGWFSPDRMTQGRMAAGFLEVSGSHPGFRFNHAKGLCIAGWSESNGQAMPLSKAAVFAVGRVPLIGRISLAGGMPFQAHKPATVRAMALRLLRAGADAYLLFATFLAHLGAALFHGLIRRDGVLTSMASWRPTLRTPIQRDTKV